MTTYWNSQKKRGLRFFLFFCALMGALQPLWSRETPRDLIQQMGLKTLHEPPIDFSLKDVQTGQVRSLKEFKGQWVWLLFWATWCPVCVRELPSIIQLSSAMKDLNLTVVSVSVDQDESQLKDYVTKNQLPFPVLFDSQGAVAQKYKASGVPTLYIVSPDEKVVGLARGAFHWNRPEIQTTIQKLLKFKEVESQFLANFESSESATLKELTPPELIVLPPSLPVQPAKWQTFEIQIKWPGPSHLYQIRTPKLTLPNEVEQGPMSSSTSNLLGDSLLKFHIPLRFKEAGHFRLGPIDLTYLPRGENGSSEQTTRHPGFDIEIAPHPLWDWKKTLSGVAMGLLVLSLLMLMGHRRRKNRSALNDSHASLSSQKVEWKSLYQKTRESRFQGSTKEYGFQILTLCEVIIKSDVRFKELPHDMEFIQRLSQTQDQLRYGGKEFSDNDLQRMEKIIENSLQ